MTTRPIFNALAHKRNDPNVQLLVAIEQNDAGLVRTAIANGADMNSVPVGRILTALDTGSPGLKEAILGPEGQDPRLAGLQETANQGRSLSFLGHAKSMLFFLRVGMAIATGGQSEAARAALQAGVKSLGSTAFAKFATNELEEDEQKKPGIIARILAFFGIRKLSKEEEHEAFVERLQNEREEREELREWEQKRREQSRPASPFDLSMRPTPR
jgi:hypothetical protein